MIPGHVREELLEARRRTALHLATSRGQLSRVGRTYSPPDHEESREGGAGAIAWVAAALAGLALTLLILFGPRVLRFLAAVTR